MSEESMVEDNEHITPSNRDAKTASMLVKANHLDFLYELYLSGVEHDAKIIQALTDAGYIKTPALPKAPREKKTLESTRFVNDQSKKTEHELEADSFLDIIEGNLNADEPLETVVTKEQYEETRVEKKFTRDPGKKITKADWLPKSRSVHTKDFIEWIDSINQGFQTRRPYRPLSIYVEQATDWLDEQDSRNNYTYEEDIRQYETQEFERCAENTLYFLNKYLKIKNSSIVDNGNHNYVAVEAHEVIAYLFDCGYSIYMGKGRQIAATSTLGGCALKKMLYSKDIFIKFITQDKETGVEIFEDKIKYPFSELPEWMKPTVSNDRDNLFKFGTKEKKGTTGGVKSKLQVVAPSVSAINGGSPDLILIDEAGYIPILSKMIKEARPTMFGKDPTTGKQILRSQLIAWGTGGQMDRGGKAYEMEYMSAMNLWKDRKFSSLIVPLFFDWTARPGINQEMYDSEKEYYYSSDFEVTAGEAPGRIQFHQHYPSSVDDMFLTSAKTIIDIDVINGHLERIRKYKQDLKPKSGYLEPIYDYNTPAHETSDVPYKIIGANFVPTEDIDARATVTIFQEPKQGWIDRYYEGTDPISSDTGTSNMSSSIWDNYYKTASAVMNYREQDYKYVFLQSYLLGLYYGLNKEPVKELLETNIGTAYRDYKETKGAWNSLVLNGELPRIFQVSMHSGNMVGLDNRGARNKMIINKIFELIQTYGDKIYIEEFWIQLKTFTCQITKTGNETWGPIDRRYYKDDVIFSVVFSYICSLCYDFLEPKQIEGGEAIKQITRYELKRDANWNLTRVPVRKPAVA